jgi:glycosyltransferase involved in cell wall biosynthesis
MVESDLRRWPASRVYAGPVWRRLRARADRRPFPEVTYGPWRPVIEEAAERIHLSRKVDLVLATANPNVSFMAGKHLHDRFGVPYVMDYRDAWSLDVFDGRRIHSADSRVGRLERELVDSAREVWFVNDTIADWHRGAYPEVADRIRVVANGWDPDLAPDGSRSPVAPDRPLTFGYLGTVSSKVPMAEFVGGWTRARELSDDVARARAVVRGYLGFYSTPQERLSTLLADAAADGVDYGGPVSKGSVGSVYDGFDVCVLILGTGRYVTSGKVYEYVATGKPVVSVHDPGNAATDVLRGYPLWFPAASLAPDDVAAALVDAGAAARTADADVRAAAREYGARFRRDLQLAPRVAGLLESVTVG